MAAPTAAATIPRADRTAVAVMVNWAAAAALLCCAVMKPAHVASAMPPQSHPPPPPPLVELRLLLPTTGTISHQTVTLAVASAGAFRMSVTTTASYDDGTPMPDSSSRSTGENPIDSPMLAPPNGTPLPPATRVTKGNFTGLKTTFGALLVDATNSMFVLEDANGTVITNGTVSPVVAMQTKTATVSRISTATAAAAAAAAAAQRATTTTNYTRSATCRAPAPGAKRTDCCPGNSCQGQQACEAKGCCYFPVNPNPQNQPWCVPAAAGPPAPPAPPAKCIGKAYPGVDVGSSAQRASDPLKGTTQEACCAACDGLTNCEVWVWATPGNEDSGDNCWLMSTSGRTKPAVGTRVLGVTRGPTPPLPPPPPPQVSIAMSASGSAKYYGSGAGGSSARTLSHSSASPRVTNTEFWTPHFYSSDGYAVLAVSSLRYTPTDLKSYPASYAAAAGSDNSDNSVTLTVDGTQADIYLMPAASHPVALSAYWDLTGRPAIPPRYAFGFSACRWGWVDHDYIVDMLTRFRNSSFPIDAWISDFEWFTKTPDYSLPEQGSPTYVDFGFNNVTFPSPVENLAQYHGDEFNLRFGGIRKPRLGNSKLIDMAHAKGWTVDADHSGGAPGGTRNLNYTIPELRQWYADQHETYLKSGVDFYWLDEGETYYHAFHWWNVALHDGLSKYDKMKRYWSVNRAYTPGMSRLGAVIWTGDISVSWDSLANQPGYVLNWHMAGVGYITCDTGGFNGADDTALLLTRWYQFAVFMPIMRVHSSLHNKPHFPFLYGDAAGNAMRNALNTRYRLLPYHYSLAHNAYRPGGISIMRPLLWSFPDDPAVADMTSQWFDGEHLMAAPVLSQNNDTSVYLPAATWYEFSSATIHTGPKNLTLSNVALDETPVYVRAGGIITLGPVIQHTGEMPGGPLEVQVYSGASGDFVLYEDDGDTYAYQQTENMREQDSQVQVQVRATQFSWADATRTLTWTVTGQWTGPSAYTSANVIVFGTSGKTACGAITLGKSGKVQCRQ